MGDRKYESIAEDLKQLRDEIEVKVHLAAADAKDEWAELEKKFEHFRGRAKVVAETAEGAAEDVGEALEKVADELKKGFKKIRGML